ALLAAGATFATTTPAAEPALVTISADQQRAFGVELAAPMAAEETLTRRYPAQVAVPNPQLRVVSTPQAGVIEALLVAEGEHVDPGQVLARLRSPELVDTQSNYLEAVTRLGLAESQLARDRKLHNEGIIAQRRLLESRASQRELSTLVEQRRQLLQLSGLSPADIDALTQSRQLSSSLPVRTPIGGVVLEQMVSTGESVATAAPLYRVAELKPLWVEVHVPVEGLGGIRLGAPVVLPTLGIEGQIITIGRMVHAEDQGVLVRAEIQTGTEKLRPGQFVEVQLSAAPTEGGSWRVPSAAVVRYAGSAYVFAARDGGFAALPVEVLVEEERTAVISGNLAKSDRLAISGVVALKAAWLAGADAGAETGSEGGAN
ncbi:MAG: efflux RND transporter periplasmic adaptor subunit, partial [Thiohalocapsa sp.]